MQPNLKQLRGCFSFVDHIFCLIKIGFRNSMLIKRKNLFLMIIENISKNFFSLLKVEYFSKYSNLHFQQNDIYDFKIIFFLNI